MGKRKQTVPHYADQAKRQQLQWNMADQFGSSASQSFICDSALKNENLNQSELADSSLQTTSSGETTSGTSTPVHALCVDAFYQNLATCHSTLTFHHQNFVKSKDKTQLLEFGSFKVILVAHPQLIPLPDQLPEFTECWLYLADAGNPSMLYFETEDNNENVNQQKRNISRQTKFGMFWFVSLSVPVAVLTNLKSKLFLMLCSDFDVHHKNFTVTIYGKEGLVLQLAHPSEAVRIKLPQMAVQRLMEFYHDINLPYNFEGRERTTGHDFFHLYECVMYVQNEKLFNDNSWLAEVDNVHHECLKPILRPYQKQSVAWMLRQEKQSRTDEGEGELHPLYCEVKLRDGPKLFYNRHAGSLIRNRPKAIPTLPGGILADEMGLGKTVEVLCCMLLHPRPDVELPEQLPVLDDLAIESSENSSSPNSNNCCSVDEMSQKKSFTDLSYENNDYQSNGHAEETNNTSSEKELIINSSKINTNSSLLVQTIQVFDTAASITPTVAKKLYSNAENSSNLISCGNNVINNGKPLAQPAYSISLQPSANNTASNEVTFLSSKTTIDITDDDAPCESLELDTSYSGSSLKEQVQLPENVQGNLSEQSIKKHNTAVINKQTEPSSNQVVIKINSKNEASIMVEGNRSVSTFSLDPPALATAVPNNVNLSITLPASQNTSSVALGNPLINSSHQLTPLHLQSNSSIEENTKLKKKGKRKSRGYIEYVPITSEDAGYFTSKPAAQKQYFECNCGQLDNDEETRRKGLNTVKCNLCGMSQHAECMNYDLKDPFRGDYRCPHCHAVSTTIKSGATLIISPYSICHQWIEEISKHIKERSIRVFIYTGVSKLGYTQPQTLAQQDIVITTYDVLRKEVDYVNLPHTNSESGRRFRHPKRFLATPSPMVAVEWWRICLDEAQMVECVTTKTAEMALRLKAVNRWCVTGTPLMRSVEDIYGLLLFLGVDPLLVQQWFRLIVWEPFCHGFSAPMHHALAQVLWRTAKKDVIDQIDLPDQSEEVNWLTFSPVEEHFYRRQYELYLRNAYANRKKAQNAPEPCTKLHALDRKTMNEARKAERRSACSNVGPYAHSN